jgi:hypothetical protein
MRAIVPFVLVRNQSHWLAAVQNLMEGTLCILAFEGYPPVKDIALQVEKMSNNVHHLLN